MTDQTAQPPMTDAEVLAVIRIMILNGTYNPVAVAAAVYKVPLDQVTPGQRQRIRALAFPYMYGAH